MTTANNSIHPTLPDPNSHKSIRKALMRFLITQFPNTFFEKERYPLKIGIAEDILKWFQANPKAHPTPSEKLLTSVLGRYTSSPKYMLCLQVDATRLDLAGKPAGKVTVQEAEYAANKLDALHQVLSARHLKKKLNAQAEVAKRAEALRQQAEKKAAKDKKNSNTQKKKAPVQPKSASPIGTPAQPSPNKTSPIIRFIRKRVTSPNDQK